MPNTSRCGNTLFFVENVSLLSTNSHHHRRFLSVCLLLVLASCPAPAYLLERGFVYCPAYPCLCQSDNGALVINCQNLYLTQLPKFLAFDGRIRTLSVQHNSIRQLPARAFYGLHVQQLDLTDNVISNIHDNTFEGLEDSLEELRLQVYAMDGFPSSALTRLKKMKVLKIIGCRVTSLNSKLFYGLARLTELHLQGCRINDVMAGSLASFKHLEVLNLEGNSLQFQSIAEIAKLPEVKELVLANNNITYLDNHAFNQAYNLRRLDLSHNNMKKIAPEAFQSLYHSLEFLRLDNNHLSENELVSLQKFRNLRRLALNKNNISTLSVGHFSGHGFLTHLDLSGNMILAITKQSLKGTEKYLQELQLSENPLRIIQNGSFQNHTRLRRLNLAGTMLGGRIWGNTFSGISQTLQKLDLSSSNLTDNDLLALSHLVAIEDLNISNNIISHISDGVFFGFRTLRRLDLSHNMIEHIPDNAFAGLRSSLEHMALNDNRIGTISLCVFESFQRLYDLRIEMNPLMCDCRLAWLHNWLQMTVTEYHRSLLEWTCIGPDSLAHRQFGSLYLSDLQCRDDVMTVPSCNWTQTLYFPKLTREVDITLPSHVNSTTFDMHVEKKKNSLHVVWNVTTKKRVTEFRVTLQRGNDSFQEHNLKVPPGINEHTFVELLADFVYEVCVTVLVEDNRRPVGRDCESVRTGNETKPAQVNYNALPASFQTLLWSYITGCLVASSLCVILVFVVRRRNQHKQSPFAFNEGYSAWSSPRYSIQSLSPPASTCYFSTTSGVNCTEEGHKLSMPAASGDYAYLSQVDLGIRNSGVHGLAGILRGGVSGSGTGRRQSTVSSFRRHLPANYIVTNIEDDFFNF